MSARTIHCAQRGCVVKLADGQAMPTLCPTCRNPLIDASSGATAPAKPARKARAPGAKGSAKAPDASSGTTD